MRTPEELENYFMSSNRGEGNSLSFKDFFAEIQKESYNQAVEDVLRELLKTDIYRQPIGKEILKLKIK